VQGLLHRPGISLEVRLGGLHASPTLYYKS
jgi:hypothetical protein